MSKIKLLTLKAWRTKRRRRLLQQVIPPEDAQEILDSQDERSTKYTTRPGFSLPLMTSNFRRFNARYGTIIL